MTIISMGKVYINGLIKEFLMVNGNLIKWTEKGNSLGLMEGNILVLIRKIKKTDTGFLNGKK